MIQVMQQKRVVRLRARGDAIGESDVVLLALRLPSLRVRGIGNHRVHIERVVGARRIRIVEVGPVIFQGIAVAHCDIRRLDASHDEVHAREIVGGLVELLSIVGDAVRIPHATLHRIADGDEQRTGSAGRIVDTKIVSAAQVMSHNVGHEHRHLVGCIEFASFLARVGSELRNQILVDVAQHVIILARTHGNGLNEVNEVAHGLRLRAGVIAELAQARLKGDKDAVEHIL